MSAPADVDVFRFHRGSTPLLLSVPHSGTHVPEPIARRMTDAGRALPDTDWFVDRLYDFAVELGASVLVATHSRYVIDLNRPPDNRNLYPGRPTPELVPRLTFAGAPVWFDDAAPDGDEVEERLARYWRPYHDRIAETLAGLRAEHGVAYLWDAHSIRSLVPRLFEGRLPDLNLGTADGAACGADVEARLAEVLDGASGYRAVRNGRFKGGYITRHHGAPADGIHAAQLELAQTTYMDEDPPYRFDEVRADGLRGVLRALLGAFIG